jgi:hypothetical protein
VTQDGVDGPVGDAHGAPAQLVEGAVLALCQLVMIKTAVVRQRRSAARLPSFPRRIGVKGPPKQAHRTAQSVVSARVGRAAGRASARSFGLAGSRGCVRFHAVRPDWVRCGVTYARTRPSACTRASQSECSSTSTSSGSSRVWATSSRRSCAWRWRRRWISVFSAGSPTFSSCAASS